CDVNGSRLRRMAPRLWRAGVSIVEAYEISGTDDPWFAGHLASADRVLIDAPCTGTGTIRRNPDLAWRLSPADTERNVSMQRALLVRAADLVRPGGRLVYATCSLLEAENEQRVAEFLSEHPNFGPVPVGEVWTRVLDSPAPWERDCVLLTPRRYGTDGFFIAILERRE
ncbi:MAG: RsmB/NOP family class I SAM-dependent RNA methyltransferase, partial [Rhodospirillaceae bacterium]|nr:RsmB/NOP family class I SAM-dependent RNA methyltransferase [Rhodospirillaceae bacterium]